MDAARRVIQGQHKTDGQQRPLRLAQQVGHRLLEKAHRVPGKQQQQGIHDRLRLERGVRKHAQQKNDRGKKSEEKPKGNGGSPRGHGAVDQAHEEKPKDVVDVHPLLPPWLKSPQERLQTLKEPARGQPTKKRSVWQTHPRVGWVLRDKSRLFTLCVSAPMDTKSTPASP